MHYVGIMKLNLLRQNAFVTSTRRKYIISEFKVMVLTLHKDMGIMQAHLTKFKETTYEVYSLQEEVHSLSNILNTKVICFPLSSWGGEAIMKCVFGLEYNDKSIFK